MSTTPTLPELLDAYVQAGIARVRVTMPGVVTAYDASRNSCTVQPQLRLPLENADGSFEFETLPPIDDVPIKWPTGKGGTCFITWPLAKGDGVELQFNDFDIGVWRTKGEATNPGDLRGHGLSGATAWPGMRTNANALPASKVHATKVVIGEGVLLGSATAAQALQLGTGYRAAEDTELTGLKAAFDTLVAAATGPLSGLAPGFTAAAAAVLAFQTNLAANGGWLSTKHKADS